MAASLPTSPPPRFPPALTPALSERYAPKEHASDAVEEYLANVGGSAVAEVRHQLGQAPTQAVMNALAARGETASQTAPTPEWQPEETREADDEDDAFHHPSSNADMMERIESLSQQLGSLTEWKSSIEEKMQALHNDSKRAADNASSFESRLKEVNKGIHSRLDRMSEALESLGKFVNTQRQILPQRPRAPEAQAPASLPEDVKVEVIHPDAGSLLDAPGRASHQEQLLPRSLRPAPKAPETSKRTTAEDKKKFSADAAAALATRQESSPRARAAGAKPFESTSRRTALPPPPPPIAFDDSSDEEDKEEVGAVEGYDDLE